MPTYSPWFGVVVIVFFVLLAAGVVAITAATGHIIGRALGREVGCLIGGCVAVGWVWLLFLIEDASLVPYSLVFFGIPLALMAASRFGRSGRRRADDGP